jgi:NADH dehydrogenase FAD-containing subunit
VPKVVIIGAGAAGTELSLAFKVRWSKFFEADIDLTLIGSHEAPLYD